MMSKRQTLGMPPFQSKDQSPMDQLITFAGLLCIILLLIKV